MERVRCINISCNTRKVLFLSLSLSVLVSILLQLENAHGLFDTVVNDCIVDGNILPGDNLDRFLGPDAAE